MITELYRKRIEVPGRKSREIVVSEDGSRISVRETIYGPRGGIYGQGTVNLIGSEWHDLLPSLLAYFSIKVIDR